MSVLVQRIRYFVLLQVKQAASCSIQEADKLRFPLMYGLHFQSFGLPPPLNASTSLQLKCRECLWVELVVYKDAAFKGGKKKWTQLVCLLALHDTHCTDKSRMPKE